MALRNISVLNVVGLICFLLAAFWLKSAMTNSRVLNDETSSADLSSASQNASPLIDALEKYRADNGFYPTTLDSLNAGYHSSGSMHGLLYSAYLGDWIYKSEACTARQKSLQGWIMETTDKYQREVAQFQSECVTGYRNYALQSGDFPSSPHSYGLERWAYYTSVKKQWELGWCSHDRQRSRSAFNGVCRW
jgi:hypothetical protein